MTNSREVPPLVTTDWLHGALGRPDLVVLDGSWYLPSAERDARAEYRAGHVPGAIFADLDQLSDLESDLPHMLPTPGQFAERIGALGVGDDSVVVVYDGSGLNLSAARLWWMLDAMGHPAVALLDGGFKKWSAEGKPLESGWRAPRVRSFTPHFDSRRVRSLDQMRANLVTHAEQVVDMRPAGRFQGTEPEPRPGLRGGHIPGSRNVPFSEFVGPDGTLLPPDLLRARIEAAGLDLSQPVVASCGSGVTACTLLHAFRVLGVDAALYDGSWSEWGREGVGTPVERG